MTTTTLTGHVAGLADDSEQLISGVAVGVGDVTRGLSGDQKVWTAEELRAAAASLEDTPVNPLHSEQTVGEVIRTGFDPERGVLYEAELEDSSLADQAANGHLEVSIEARHADGGTVETDRGEAMLATDIQFTGLSLVQRGAAPSASASAGEAAALSATAIHERLEDPASTDGDASDIEISDSVEEGLQNKVDEHNEEAPESKQVTLGMLKKVFRRGAGAWLNSNAGATQQQWAYARVNAYLEDLMADRALNSGNDNDLAPDGYDPPGESEENATLVNVNGTEVDIEPPERVINAIEAGFEAKDQYSDAIGDCGTGVGEAMGQAILDGPTVDLLVDGGDVASNAPATYLDSHSEDAPSTDAPPTEWDEATWTDGCGPVQDALWGHYLDWFEGTKADLEAAMEGEEMGYNSDEKANMAETPDEYIFDNPGEAVSKAEEMGVGEGEDMAGDEMIHSHGSGEDTVFMPAPSHDALMDMLEEMGELADAELKAVGPVEFGATGEGELDESELPNDADEFEGHYLNAAETKSESSFPLVDADGTLRRGNLDAAWNLRGQGDLGMPRDAAERVMRSLGREFGEPDEEANPIPQDAYEEADMAAGDTDDAVSPESGRAEAGGERTDSQTTTNTANMSETEEELRARLSEKDDRIAELQSKVEQLNEEREQVARAYAEALAAGDTVLDEDAFVPKFTVAELAERYESVEDAALADAEPTVQSGDSDTETASLSESEQDEVADLRGAIDELSNSDTRLAEIQREQHAERIAELTGEDTDAVLAEH
jgi:molybdopterin converting factor small subunit